MIKEIGLSMRRPILLGICGIPENFIWKVNLVGRAFIKRDGDLNVENRMVPYPMQNGFCREETQQQLIQTGGYKPGRGRPIPAIFRSVQIQEG